MLRWALLQTKSEQSLRPKSKKKIRVITEIKKKKKKDSRKKNTKTVLCHQWIVTFFF
jgi:hypothetical protein